MRASTFFRILMSGLAAAGLLAMATPATADTINGHLTVQGTPTSIKQGETKTFTILVAVPANTTVQAFHAPAVVTVESAYVIGGAFDGFRRPQASVFQADSCLLHPKSGQCTDKVVLEAKQYAVAATISATATAALGTYEVVIGAHGDQALGIGSKPSFMITVEPAGAAPSVDINSPQNGACVAMGSALPVSISVISALSYTLNATLNDAALAMRRNADGEWDGMATGLQVGSNALRAAAVNSRGAGTASSTMTASYNGFTWLPPVTTAKFQRGRTLPVKFRVGDANGLASGVLAVVTLDGVPVGIATEGRDEIGPFYQLHVALPSFVGVVSVGVDLMDGNCFNSARTATVSIK